MVCKLNFMNLSIVFGVLVSCASSATCPRVPNQDYPSIPDTPEIKYVSPHAVNEYPSADPISEYPLGSCGPKFGNNQCESIGGEQACCSAHGFCGTTADYCHPDAKCSGQCWEGAPAFPYSLTELCGPLNKGLPCNPNTPGGGCCSKAGYCGDSEEHCSVDLGCLSGCK